MLLWRFYCCNGHNPTETILQTMKTKRVTSQTCLENTIIQTFHWNGWSISYICEAQFNSTWRHRLLTPRLPDLLKEIVEAPGLTEEDPGPTSGSITSKWVLHEFQALNRVSRGGGPQPWGSSGRGSVSLRVSLVYCKFWQEKNKYLKEGRHILDSCC